MLLDLDSYVKQTIARSYHIVALNVPSAALSTATAEDAVKWRAWLEKLMNQLGAAKTVAHVFDPQRTRSRHRTSPIGKPPTRPRHRHRHRRRRHATPTPTPARRLRPRADGGRRSRSSAGSRPVRSSSVRSLHPEVTMQIRTIVALGSGHRRRGRRVPGRWPGAEEPGLIFEIEDKFFVQAAVVEAITARAARVDRTENTVEMQLIRRGVLQFRVAEFSVDRPDHVALAPRYGKLYLVTLQAERAELTVRDVLIELAAYGLARPGQSFTTRTAFERGQGRPLSFEIVPREVEIEREARRPSGSYFRSATRTTPTSDSWSGWRWIPGSDSDLAGPT
jgi:hypothetical protein